MSFPAYPEYKDSGAEWLGKAPKHWGIVPLWTLFRRQKITGYPQEELLSVYRDYGVIPKKSRDDNNNKSSDDLSLYQLVISNDLVINKMKSWQGSVAISMYRGIVSPAYFVLKSNHNQDSRFLHYLFRSARYIVGYLSISKGIRINQWDLDPQYHSRMPVLLPPLEEQTAIAAFLDRETGKIDALIAEQEKLLTLLAEKRQATISHAVTRGLNPNAPMKDSGVAWLGEVPEHWEIVQLRRVVDTFEQGWSPECEARVINSHEWGVLKSGCVNTGVFSPEEHKALPVTLNPREELEILHGDILMSRASGSPKLIGSVAQLFHPPPRLMLSDKIFRLKLYPVITPEFFVQVMGAIPLRSQIEQAISGAEGLANNLSQNKIKTFRMALPPKEEQIKIIKYLKSEIGKRENIESIINLLKERRSTLIAAAVTGKIDVRNATPQGEAA